MGFPRSAIRGLTSTTPKDTHEGRVTKRDGRRRDGWRLAAVVMNPHFWISPARVSGERHSHRGYRLVVTGVTLRIDPAHGPVVLCHLRQEDRVAFDGDYHLVLIHVHGQLLDVVSAVGRQGSDP